jgi:hypothetical protein
MLNVPSHIREFRHLFAGNRRIVATIRVDLAKVRFRPLRGPNVENSITKLSAAWIGVNIGSYQHAGPKTCKTRSWPTWPTSNRDPTAINLL